MVESLQMFLFLFKSKYRRKSSWYSPFLCSVLIVLLFCDDALSKCSGENCLNGECRNETCICNEGWQGPECQYCGGKIKLTTPSGVITDGPGNYSVSVQCSWLLAPPWLGPDPPPIRVRLETFATECGWDHLYIYDGDSVRAQRLLAVFSGVLDQTGSAWTRQVVARSGRALLHFFSDDAYAMEGFNITYAAYSCPSDNHHTNCSEHGDCVNGICRCFDGWVGVACDQSICPNDCNADTLKGTCTPRGCICEPTHSSEDCGRERARHSWSWLWREPHEGASQPPPGAPPPAAAYSLLQYNDTLLRVGGETFAQAEFLYKYLVEQRRWEAIEARGAPAPAPRFAHSAIVHGHELIVYGGVVASDEPERGGGLAGLEGRAGEVTNEVWRLRLDAARPQWRNATPTACHPHHVAPMGHCGGLHVSGHSAVLVGVGTARKPVMLVFFGHSPVYGYLHTVLEYHIEDGFWTSVPTRGWPARAGFGHTAVYDNLSRRVYVHGGLVSESEATQAPSARLFEYDVDNRVWKLLPTAPTPRYLHSATFISPGVMLVFGGNAHNDSAAATVTNPANAKCYSGGALLYDVRCSAWRQLQTPQDAARAAHAAQIMPGIERSTAVIMGGFDGRLRSDALLFEVGQGCSGLTEEACLANAESAAVACAWKVEERLCTSLAEVGWKESFDGAVRTCTSEPTLDDRRCFVASTCTACTSAGCAWCGACYDSPAYCPRARRQMALSIEECGANLEAASVACVRFHSCAACHAHRAHGHDHKSDEVSEQVCYWDYDTIKCRPVNNSEDARTVAANGGCTASCSSLQSCANCTAEECIWCASAARCVDKNAYAASFPLGGCRAWSTGGGGCGPRTGCAVHASCAACRAEPACGWCDNGLGNGRGACLPGGAVAPHSLDACPTDRWHFTRCPTCQCNGHSVCEESGRCMQPCGGRIVGEHCDTCAPGHWGSSLNGGVCQRESSRLII